MGENREEQIQHIRHTSSKPEYSRICRCGIHDRRNTAVLAKTSGKDLRKQDLKWLIDNKLLSPNGSVKTAYYMHIVVSNVLNVCCG